MTAYRRAASRKTDIERQTEGKDKTGVFTGGWAINPVNGARIPVFVADYVLMGYGTGAIMAVPGQDERDWDFATAFDLPIIRTVQPTEGHDETTAFTGDGPAINSSNDEVSLDGLGVAEAKARITAYLEERGLGEATVTYKLRDWLFSRQRYWGEPFPVVFDEDGIAHGVPESMLPVELPGRPGLQPEDLRPRGREQRARAAAVAGRRVGRGRPRPRRRPRHPPLPARDQHDAQLGRVVLVLPALPRPGQRRRSRRPRERGLLDGAAPEPVAGAPAGTRDPGGVDLYVGGVEHAVLHLLYARFWHKVLHDLGHLSSEEPFRTYFSQGYIQAPAFTDGRGQYVEAKEVQEGVGDDGHPAFTWNGEPVSREFGKIGKSLKNMVSPDEMYAAFGADTFRLYEMGLGPLEQSKPWDTRAVVGRQRLLQRLWRNVVDEETGAVVVVDAPMDDATSRMLHRTIDAVRTDYAELGFNTAIARLTELNNALTKLRAPGCRARPPSRSCSWSRRSPRTSPRSCGCGSGTRTRSCTPRSPSPTRRCSSRTR